MEQGRQKPDPAATQSARALLERRVRRAAGGPIRHSHDGFDRRRPGRHLDEHGLLRAREARRGDRPPQAPAGPTKRTRSRTTFERLPSLAQPLRRAQDARGARASSRSASREVTSPPASGSSAGSRQALAQLPDHGYRLYLESLFDELGQRSKVLFDRRDPAGLLWPRRQALNELLAILNDPSCTTSGIEDETIGWVYQYFNSGEERKKMRDASASRKRLATAASWPCATSSSRPATSFSSSPTTRSVGSGSRCRAGRQHCQSGANT